MVAKKRAEGLNLFSKYSGIERIFVYTIIGSHPNRKKGIKNQSFMYVIVEAKPYSKPLAEYFTKL